MYWSAIILGFLGSMHCVVMCGPIALTLQGQPNLQRFLFTRVAYNLGRITTYAGLGVLLGLAGKGIQLADFQQVLSIVLGLSMILLAIALYQRHQINLGSQYLRAINSVFKRSFGRFLQSKNPMSTYLVGLINGFLPCGLVYAALAGALATADISTGAWYMTVFGLGTFPAMLVVSLGGKLLGIKINSQMHKISSLFVLALGLILIVRGLHLDIPYLSPVIGFLYPLDAGMTICQ
ncbi:sulfite exporter TauE/SafE family protein [Reichenbachiella agarivorans]|uniref:Sulfite exporter TauE/SafE family protein n=1 Tax=Reichenbachiella agarivorans TaxID=2979464 RepID=A0ABY6CMZ0_9BACT|nr:sulfite exporter TauE/SafE family protein [Reichenbachiella agarivorans]UXP31420.1 sulfite exporter TauE/SafE family protein [Reichenbachiella agarivorans]